MSETVTYDPTKHDGCLYVNGRFFIIASAEDAKLHELPLVQRQEIRRQTAANPRGNKNCLVNYRT